MPLILFKYENSPVICKQTCNSYKNWTPSSSLNVPSYGRPASVSTNCLRPCVTCFVGWFLPALWVPMTVIAVWRVLCQKHGTSVRGKCVPGFFPPFDLVFMCWEPFFPCIRIKSEFWFESWGGSFFFFPGAPSIAIPGRRHTYTVSRDYWGLPGRAARKGRVF